MVDDGGVGNLPHTPDVTLLGSLHPLTTTARFPGLWGGYSLPFVAIAKVLWATFSFIVNQLNRVPFVHIPIEVAPESLLRLLVRWLFALPLFLVSGISDHFISDYYNVMVRP